jgi:hypothetical protein
MVIVYIFTGYSVTLQYVYTLCNAQVRVIGISIISVIYHSFVLGTFKILLATVKYN